MLHILFALYCLSQLAHGTSAHTTSPDGCPPLDGTTRSVWSILGSCALTLLICVWHTIHFDLPNSQKSWFKKPVGLVLTSFFAPEVIVASASTECWDAYDKVVRFRDAGYRWSMTHSFFAEMGGFEYSGKTIKSFEFLEYCKKNEIANPLIKVEAIMDKSKSDWIGKAILAVQLLWFMLQVVVRGSRGLAITLVELDTVCMAVLSLLVLALWWDKPLRPRCAHVFYSRQEVKGVLVTDSTLSTAWKSEHTCVDWLMARFTRTHKPPSTAGDRKTAGERTDEKSTRPKSRRLVDEINQMDVMFTSLCVSWLILGGLHLIAWDFELPTETKRVMWRSASLVLAGGSPAFFGIYVIVKAYNDQGRHLPDWMEHVCATTWLLAGVLGVVSRAVLVGLMLASLRSLPCSAHETVSWTAFIPHL